MRNEFGRLILSNKIQKKIARHWKYRCSCSKGCSAKVEVLGDLCDMCEVEGCAPSPMDVS